MSTACEVLVNSGQGEVTEGQGQGQKGVKKQEKCEPDLESGQLLEKQIDKDEKW